jgi:hypothetical protein
MLSNNSRFKCVENYFLNCNQNYLLICKRHIKKNKLRSNGRRFVDIKGIEGTVRFSLERYKQGGDYFQQTAQFTEDLDSAEVKSWILMEIQDKSYAKVSDCLLKVSGSRLYSGNHICKKVKMYAQEQTQSLISSYSGCQLCIPFADSTVDIYAANSAEILLFDDEICVKRQKEVRDPTYVKSHQRVYTTVMEVQKPLPLDLNCLNSPINKPEGTFDYLTNGYGVPNWTIQTALCCWFSAQYGNVKLPIVAITDGAKDIRRRLNSVFGGQIIIILDWYHLNKKIWLFMTMIAQNKAQKLEDGKNIVHLLWEGRTDEAIAYLKNMAPKNKEKHKELIIYLENHKEEIINYKKRKHANKTIGSGRAEKGVDMVVAQRQKNKPIAWSQNGSHALSTLRADYLNLKNAA